MVRKMTIALLMTGALAITACNTVRGAAADVNSAANCAENAINNGYCK
nr:entericidin EcnA/B family protein [uncultured Sphingomonas sp.]